ncbi:hypothetical protein, partial [Marinobacter halodurans]|uniref:hypothetical protein n=1 Tax=Marinobacter halodurans TaxID=2528979 RepID=UPI001A95632E
QPLFFSAFRYFRKPPNRAGCPFKVARILHGFATLSTVALKNPETRNPKPKQSVTFRFRPRLCGGPLERDAHSTDPSGPVKPFLTLFSQRLGFPIRTDQTTTRNAAIPINKQPGSVVHRHAADHLTLC